MSSMDQARSLLERLHSIITSGPGGSSGLAAGVPPSSSLQPHGQQQNDQPVGLARAPSGSSQPRSHGHLPGLAASSGFSQSQQHGHQPGGSATSSGFSQSSAQHGHWQSVPAGSSSGGPSTSSRSGGPSTAATPMGPPRSPYHVHQSLFGYKRAAGNSKKGSKKTKLVPWSHMFVCLADPESSVVPSDYSLLAANGLGKKKLLLYESSDAMDIHEAIMAQFPKLSDAGGY